MCGNNKLNFRKSLFQISHNISLPIGVGEGPLAVAAQAALEEDALGAVVVQVGDGDDARQAEGGKAVSQHGAAHLAGISAAPELGREHITDLDV